MRLLKFLLTGLFAAVAVLAGLFATMVVALTGALVILLRRLLRGNRTPRSGTAMRGPTYSETREPPRESDAIDVVATEVPADRHGR